MERQPAKFFQNLEQVNLADTASQAYAGTGARPRTPDNPGDVEPRPLSDRAGPSRPALTEYREFFDIEPDTPVFKMPRLPLHAWLSRRCQPLELTLP